VAITTIPGATSSDLTTLKGTALADTFAIEGKNQFIEGLEGADTVTAASGIESITIDTGADNDTVTLSGEANKVLIDLQGGNDALSLVDALNSTVNAGTGNDTITQGATRTFETGNIFGNTGNDVFTFVNLEDAYVGGDQDDDSITVSGSSVNSTIRGGNQRDTISVAGAIGGIIKGDKQEDQITLTGTNSGLYVGGDSDDDVFNIGGTTTTTTVRGGAGKDDMNITSLGALITKGDDGIDDIDQSIGNVNHTIYGGAGGDSIDASSTAALLIYGDGEAEDTTTGGDGADTITLTGIASSKGAHSIYGGAGKDSITTATGDADEFIDAGSGDDTISAKAGQDTIYARAGKDAINLAGTNAAGTYFNVRAGADDDVISLDATAFASLSINDTIKGDLGTDTLAITGAAANFDMTAVGSAAASAFDNVSVETFALGTSTTALTLAGTRTYTFSAAAQSAGIRNFDATETSGSGSARLLTVDASAYTSAAPVTLSGSKDGDVVSKLVGGSGNDTLNDGAVSTAADETLTGGAGVDTFNVTATTAGTQVTDLGLGGSAEVLTVSSTAHSADVEVLGDFVATSASSNNQSTAGVVLTAAAGIDINMGLATGNFGYTLELTGSTTTASTLQGSAKADVIDGEGGADSLVGNAGNDTITAAAGNDTISGGDGDDSITAGAGSDSANGGGGNDTFVVATGDSVAGDSVTGGTGTDSIAIANGTADWAGEFDFDNIDGVTSLATTGLGTGTNEHVTVTFSAITETTAQTVSLTAASITDADADLVIVNSAASSTTSFNITGGVGNDTLIGSDGADTLSGGALADTITGGLGGDILVGGAADTFVMGAGATVTNTGAVVGGSTDIRSGLDIITTAANDLFNFAAFDNTTIADAATADGTTFNSGVANSVSLVSGTYDPSNGTFTAGAYSGSANDTLLQVAGGATTTTINNFLLLDSGALATITFSSEIGTLA
jgi:Ca2+-binding RTX toxin-like protein